MKGVSRCAYEQPPFFDGDNDRESQALRRIERVALIEESERERRLCVCVFVYVRICMKLHDFNVCMYVHVY